MTDKDFIEKIKTLSFSVKQSPPWIPSVDPGKIANDPEASQKYYDHVDSESKKWVNSGYWKRREAERKHYIKSQKAEWIKRGARPDDRDEIMKP